MKDLLPNNMVKFTTFVKYNDKFEQNHDNYAFEKINNKQIFHAFLFNIRNCSPKVSNIQRREAELNIILRRVNKFDIKQKSAWDICFIIYPQHSTKYWVNANKAK